ncbi:hypothetical protein JCM30204_40950 [Dysgonomonas termitidis]
MLISLVSDIIKYVFICDKYKQIDSEQQYTQYEIKKLKSIIMRQYCNEIRLRNGFND